MRVLINMEMPTSCAECRFCGEYCYAKGDEDAQSNLSCPLVPVPPHGDLIERDNALACVSCDLSKKDYNVSYQGLCIEMAFRLINVPTVIEAEEGE